MSGALGPLQADAVQGAITFLLDPDRGGTRIVAEYVLAVTPGPAWIASLLPRMPCWKYRSADSPPFWAGRSSKKRNSGES